MRELQTISANMHLLEGSKNDLVGMAEVIFVFSEPHYQHDGGGGVAKIRKLETVRFSAGAKALQGIIDTLIEYKEDLERLQERVILKPETEDE